MQRVFRYKFVPSATLEVLMRTRLSAKLKRRPVDAAPSLIVSNVCRGLAAPDKGTGINFPAEWFADLPGACCPMLTLK